MLVLHLIDQEELFSYGLVILQFHLLQLEQY